MPIVDDKIDSDPEADEAKQQENEQTCLLNSSVKTLKRKNTWSQNRRSCSYAHDAGMPGTRTNFFNHQRDLGRFESMALARADMNPVKRRQGRDAQI